MWAAPITSKDLQKALVDIDLDRTADEIIRFIRDVVAASHAKGVVVGLSGGVDSSLAAILCVQALGKKRVLGVLMPLAFTPSQDMDDANELARTLGIPTQLIPIQGITEAFFSELNVNAAHRLPKMNIRCRTRMIVLYYFANLHNYLVVGTGDKSEDLIGFFTKYGDGAADFFVISHLYKTQVRLLAAHLGLPRQMTYKPSSPQLYPGHKATDEIPLDYDVLDLILVGLFDKKLPVQDVSRVLAVSVQTVNNILKRFTTSKHKRAFPPMVKPWTS